MPLNCLYFQVCGRLTLPHSWDLDAAVSLALSKYTQKQHTCLLGLPAHTQVLSFSSVAWCPQKQVLIGKHSKGHATGSTKTTHRELLF